MNIKLLKWNELTALSLDTDKSVALLSTGSVVAQDRLDFIDALALTVDAISIRVETVTTTTYTAEPTDTYIVANDTTAGGIVTITLPPAATAGEGCQIYIKKIGNTANVVIDGNAAETIDGAATATLTTQYESIDLVCDGTGWYIF